MRWSSSTLNIGLVVASKRMPSHTNTKAVTTVVNKHFDTLQSGIIDQYAELPNMKSQLTACAGMLMSIMVLLVEVAVLLLWLLLLGFGPLLLSALVLLAHRRSTRSNFHFSDFYYMRYCTQSRRSSR